MLEPKARLVAFAHGQHIMAKHPADARGAVENTGDDRDQRRLAATGRPHQHEQFAGLDPQVDAAQRLHCGLAAAVNLGQAATFHGRRDGVHHGQALNTAAGSRRKTLSREMLAERMQMISTPPAENASSSGVNLT